LKSNPKLYKHEEIIDKEFINVYNRMENLPGIQGLKGDIGPAGPQGPTGVAGPGVPSAGSTEQILSKIDGVDYNTHWVDKPHGIPSGGSATYALVKIDGTDYNVQWSLIDSNFVGLGNVDNTSDSTKNAATVTLTNKRITSRVTAIASNATPTINTDNCDAVDITALAADITSMTTNLTGTPTNFQKLIIRIKDNGTARAITWGASFEARGVSLPTTTVISKVLTIGFIYDTTTSKWGCVASAQEA